MSAPTQMGTILKHRDRHKSIVCAEVLWQAVNFRPCPVPVCV